MHVQLANETSRMELWLESNCIVTIDKNTFFDISAKPVLSRYILLDRQALFLEIKIYLEIW